jgi:hypothetical protein
LKTPFDVLEGGLGGGFIVANYGKHNLVQMSRYGAVLDVYGSKGSGDGEFKKPSALAGFPDGGLVVREFGGRRIQMFTGRL